MNARPVVPIIAVLYLITGLDGQQPANDEAYGKKIREHTTEARFLTPLVDHLPASSQVPSPLEYFGTIIGAPGILHHTKEIYAYLQAVADASPRVTIRHIGKTEEDRDMIEVIIADEATMGQLDTYRGYLQQLSDPRKISESKAAEIIAKSKPVYYATTGLHSPETGGPEMFMELTYRLAVGESDLIRSIRENLILVLVPVTEPDGRDRMFDVANYAAANNGVGPPLIYWGHYVAHDNNRDGFGLTLALTRNILAAFEYWKPTVGHDLHESVPYLYISTGTGPYNEYIDALTIDEWHNLAHEEVTQLTKMGLPGVWTHGFYTGWASNYLLWIFNLRNSIGRFYETFGNSYPQTFERKLQERRTSREWYRPNPPLEKVQWSLRNNTNYSQSGLLIGLGYVADNATDMVETFYIKSKRAIAAGKSEKPYAWVIPSSQTRSADTQELVALLMAEGLEVHQASGQLNWEAEVPDKKGDKDNKKGDKKKTKKVKMSAPARSYIVRLDQPYRALALNLLGKQNFPKDATPPYDDTGWTLPYLWQVKAHKVDDPAILKAKMTLLKNRPKPAGKVTGKRGGFYLINQTGEDNLATLRFRLGDVSMTAAEKSFTSGKKTYQAGSYIIPRSGNPGNLDTRIAAAAKDLGVQVVRVSKKPTVKAHNLETPRVALVHTWVATPQDAGWWRAAFDKLEIPYTYLSEQDLATEDLSSFDVIIMPRSRATPQRLVDGTTTAGQPIPWKKSDLTPHLGLIDETDDVRRGMGYQGLTNLKAFIAAGGLFITEGSSAAFPIEMGITKRVSISRPKGLVIRGSVVRAEVEDSGSPVVYGYQDTLAVYFSGGPVLKINKRLGDKRVPDWLKDQTWTSEVPRIILKFPEKNILLSGMLKGEKGLSGVPMVVDVPVGKGHVLLFANRPFWRGETIGSHALVFNAMLNWNDLHINWPDRPEEDEIEERSQNLDHGNFLN